VGRVKPQALFLRETRTLPTWLAILGIVLCVADAAFNYFIADDSANEIVDEMAGELRDHFDGGDAVPSPAESSWEEDVALHYVERGMWMREFLKERTPGDGLAGRLLRWMLLGGSMEEFEQETVDLMEEAREATVFTMEGYEAAIMVLIALDREEEARAWLNEMNEEYPDAPWATWLPTLMADDPSGIDEVGRRIVREWMAELEEWDGRLPWWTFEKARRLCAASGFKVPELLEQRRLEKTREWDLRFRLGGWAGFGLFAIGVLCLPFVFLRHRHHPQEIEIGKSRIARRWGILQMLGWFGWITVAATLAVLILGFILADTDMHPDWLIVFWQLLMLVFTLRVWRLAGRPGLRLAGLRPLGQGLAPRWLLMVSGAYGLGMLLHYVIFLPFDGASLDELLDSTEAGQLEDRELMPMSLFLSVLTAVVLAPVIEEIMHRGVVHQAIRTRWGVFPSMLASSALFSVMHFYTPLGLLSVFVSGMIFAWLYERTRSLWPPILCHALLNASITFDQWVVWGPR